MQERNWSYRTSHHVSGIDMLRGALAHATPRERAVVFPDSSLWVLFNVGPARKRNVSLEEFLPGDTSEERSIATQRQRHKGCGGSLADALNQGVVPDQAGQRG